MLQPTDIVRARFDNARITASCSSYLTIMRQGNNAVVRWQGTGRLEQAGGLGNSAAWQLVTPAPVGSSFTLPLSQATKIFFRVRE